MLLLTLKSAFPSRVLQIWMVYKTICALYAVGLAPSSGLYWSKNRQTSSESLEVQLFHGIMYASFVLFL